MYIWLDDERPMPSQYDVHIKTVAEAIALIQTGECQVISFDHDLGTEQTGYDLAKWIAEQAYHGNVKPIGWTVHSANPVGRENIIGAMRTADNFWARNGML